MAAALDIIFIVYYGIILTLVIMDSYFINKVIFASNLFQWVFCSIRLYKYIEGGSKFSYITKNGAVSIKKLASQASSGQLVRIVSKI